MNSLLGFLQNADPDVRVDMETFLNKVVPEVRVSSCSLLNALMLSCVKAYQAQVLVDILIYWFVPGSFCSVDTHR